MWFSCGCAPAVLFLIYFTVSISMFSFTLFFVFSGSVYVFSVFSGSVYTLCILCILRQCLCCLLQLNFLVCQFIGLALAIPFRTILSPKNTSPRVRLVVELVVGVALTVFCFGQ